MEKTKTTTDGCTTQVNAKDRFSSKAGPSKESQEKYQKDAIANNSFIKVQQAPSIKSSQDSELYKMTSKPRGHAIIINNIKFKGLTNRDGAEHDSKSMKELLNQLFFEVKLSEDRKEMDMRTDLREFASKSKWADVDCAIIVIMSHGDAGDSVEESVIYGTDHNGIRTLEIQQYFSAANCPQLNGKPKIFIFQACRGSALDGTKLQSADSTTRTDSNPGMERGNVKIRSCSDTFVAYAVPPGVVAYRDKDKGAWFIQTIVQVFADHSHKYHLQELFNMVDKKLKERSNNDEIQAINITSTGWSQLLYFNPGCYQEENIQMRQLTLENSDYLINIPRKCDELCYLLQIVNLDYQGDWEGYIDVSSNANASDSNETKRFSTVAKTTVSKNKQWNEFFIVIGKPTDKLQFKTVQYRQTWLGKTTREKPLNTMLMSEILTHTFPTAISGFDGRHLKIKSWILNDNITKFSQKKNSKTSVDGTQILPVAPDQVPFEEKLKYLNFLIKENKSEPFHLNVSFSQMQEDSYNILLKGTYANKLRGKIIINDQSIDYKMWRSQVENFQDGKLGWEKKGIDANKLLGRYHGHLKFNGARAVSYDPRHLLHYKMMLKKEASLKDTFYDERFRKWLERAAKLTRIKNALEKNDRKFVISETVDGSEITHSLKPDGENIAVTDENKEEFLNLCVNFLFVEPERAEVNSYQTGLTDIIPHEWMLMFDEIELKMFMEDIPDLIYMQSFRERYVGYTREDEIITWFWDAIYALNDEMRARLHILQARDYSWIIFKVIYKKNCSISIDKDEIITGDGILFNKYSQTIYLPCFPSRAQLETSLMNALKLKTHITNSAIISLLVFEDKHFPKMRRPKL